MRQVPVFTSYLLVGGGRAARHLSRYFELESLPFQTWTRQESQTAWLTKAESASHVILAISDSAIESFRREHPELDAKTVVHLSGALSSPLLPSAHPLMTFSHEAYDLETYRRIPFILEKGRGEPETLLPGLKNPFFAIDAGEKTLYHALCVLTGNFTVLLWEKAFREFTERLGLPKSVLLPYLEQTAKNLSRAPLGSSVLTGPLVRGDRTTVERHLKVLSEDPYAGVYRAFTEAFAAEKASGGAK